jgi:uridine kinase
MTRSTPLVVGLAGGTASGKTTLCRALADHLGDQAAVLCHDSYYRTLPADRSPATWNFDHPDALETALLVSHVDALCRGETVSVPCYDFARHRRQGPEAWATVQPRPVLLVEGILVLADPELRRRMHHRVFVQTPDDIRLARRLRRDLAERGREVDDVLEQYLGTVRPMHETFVVPSRAHAHDVLDGTRPVAELVAAVLPHLG